VHAYYLRDRWAILRFTGGWNRACTSVLEKISPLLLFLTFIPYSSKKTAKLFQRWFIFNRETRSRMRLIPVRFLCPGFSNFENQNELGWRWSIHYVSLGDSCVLFMRALSVPRSAALSLSGEQPPLVDRERRKGGGDTKERLRSIRYIEKKRGREREDESERLV